MQIQVDIKESQDATGGKDISDISQAGATVSLPLRCEVTAGFDCTWLHFTRGGSLAVISAQLLHVAS